MTETVEFMKVLEGEYLQASQLGTRSEYKIFYGQVFKAPILTLGKNPGGNPDETSADGTCGKGGMRACASASYFENMEHDVLDCEWAENTGLRKLLLPLVGHDPDRFRREVVKTNVAFRRSRSVQEIDLATAEQEAIPFIEQIMMRVDPKLIVLTGVPIGHFLARYAQGSRQLTETTKHSGIGHVVFAASQAQLRSTGSEVIVVQVTHASQFSWTYGKYDVAAKIAELLGNKASSIAATDYRNLPISGLDFCPIITGGSRRPDLQMFKSPTMNQHKADASELEMRWKSLPKNCDFPQVHHFFPRRQALDGFVDWCQRHDKLKTQNLVTLKRALYVARQVKDGQEFESALAAAWAKFPKLP